VINIIKKEHPEWFDEDLEQRIYDACQTALS
jgi:ribonucleotide reductase beta subunit family protein with ferritin-like domain